jgi:hypothetical protein
LAAAAAQNQSVVNPFETNILQNGLPYLPQLLDYSSGTVAQSYAPAQGNLNRSLAGFGSNLPSGFATQSQTDLDSQEANAQDTNTINALQQNQNAKTNAATALNPLGYYTGSTGANSSVLSAPPVNSGGVGNFIGGLASGLVNNASVSGTGSGVSAFSL